MVAYSFNGKWLPDWMSEKERKEAVFKLIRKGIKDRTTRVKLRAHAGDTLQLYWKQRTKDCELIARAKCMSAYPVKIDHNRQGVYADAAPPIHDRFIWAKINAEYFAKKEGFQSVSDMFKFFEDGVYHTVEWEDVRW